MLHALEAEIRLYDRLFDHPAPDASKDGKGVRAHLNPESLQILTACYLEPSLGRAEQGEVYQFEREGYFCRDSQQTEQGAPTFNRTMTLRDSWAKIEKQTG